jgi:UDP-sulfoquinovose synthase
MSRILCSPPEAGQYEVVNQISGVYTVAELAETVGRIGMGEFNLPVKIQRLENPRVEADDHLYEAIYEKLPKQLGFVPAISLEEEVYQMFRVLTRPGIKSRIEEKQHVILPKTRWSGMKKDMDVLEVYNIDETTKEGRLEAAS